ncbi:hypothetical protein TNCV_186381 [Trichonephila clavipes]|nr:hypothetical protein TNCV_186381 [Trichonephila clavipes]
MTPLKIIWRDRCTSNLSSFQISRVGVVWKFVEQGDRSCATLVTGSMPQNYEKAFPISIVQLLTTANDSLCCEEFRGPRSDTVRQVALETTTNHTCRGPGFGIGLAIVKNTKLEDS